MSNFRKITLDDVLELNKISPVMTEVKIKDKSEQIQLRKKMIAKDYQNTVSQCEKIKIQAQ